MKNKEELLMDQLYDLTKSIKNLTSVLDQGFGEIQSRLEDLSNSINEIQSLSSLEESIYKLDYGIGVLTNVLEEKNNG